MSENLSRNNHYLSQMYLEAWKNENNKVEVYELLVPNIKAPLWQSKSIRSVGSLDNIFVRLKNGKETDDIEKWFVFHEARNMTSHDYDGIKAQEVLGIAIEF